MPGPLQILLTPLGRALRGRRSGPERSALARPGWDAPPTIEVRSTSYEDGARIDDRHSMRPRGRDLSPQLSWTGVPPETRQLVLVFEDLDLPFRVPGFHTMGLVPADVTGVEEGELTSDHARIRWIPLRGGRTAYHGPFPMPGHGVHHYFFHIIALDEAVPADAPLPDVAALDAFVAGHAIARGSLEGWQEG